MRARIKTGSLQRGRGQNPCWRNYLIENCVTSCRYTGNYVTSCYTGNCVTSCIYGKLCDLLYIQKILSPLVYFVCEHLWSASPGDEPKALHGTTVALFSASEQTYCALVNETVTGL